MHTISVSFDWETLTPFRRIHNRIEREARLASSPSPRTSPEESKSESVEAQRPQGTDAGSTTNARWSDV